MRRANSWTTGCVLMVALFAAVAYRPAAVLAAQETSTILVSLPVGGEVAGLALGAGAAWVVNGRAGTVSRIDPSTNQVVATIHIAEPSSSCDRCWGAVAA